VRALYAALAGTVHGGAAALRMLPGVSPRTRQHLGERLGDYASPAEPAGRGPSVWVHAASVGEVRAVEALIAALAARYGGARFVVTCQTETGRALARSIRASAAYIAPLDSRAAVERALDRVRPDVFLLVENEIWPRLLSACAARGVPVAMVNARVSERSFARYALVRSLFAEPLSSLARVCARDEASARRLVTLGARPEATLVCGDLKAAALDDAVVSATAPALPALGDGTPYALALSTHEGEDEIVLDAFDRLRAAHPGLRLVLAPRHPERRAAVLALAKRHGRSAAWSEARDAHALDWSVLVLDTTGESRGFLRGAACGFVGGSLVPVGGHNLAEPAGFRVPVAVGPHLESVMHQRALLEAHGALSIVHDAVELAATWQQWLADPDVARAAAAAAHDAFVTGASALPQTLAAIEPLFVRAAANRERS
jgi:3-deoxy-D-manno-octulosonic-acid transferase